MNVDEEYLISKRKEIGVKLREIRESRGLTKEQLAQTMEIDISSLNKIEKGKFNFSIDTLNAIAAVLEFNLELVKRVIAPALNGDIEEIVTAEWVTNKMRERGISQNELAELTNTDKFQISKWLSGNRNPSGAAKAALYYAIMYYKR